VHHMCTTDGAEPSLPGYDDKNSNERGAGLLPVQPVLPDAEEGDMCSGFAGESLN
jgi:hypothetical protein